MSFEEIYRQYFRDVYLFILSMSGSQDVAEEITQETFYKALRGIRKFKGDCSIKTWLCQIAKNTYLNHLKENKHLTGEYKPDDILEAYTIRTAEEILIERDERLRICQLIQRLEEPYREVFVLRAAGELSFREIGEIYERKEGWARITYHRARLKLQEWLKEVPL